MPTKFKFRLQPVLKLREMREQQEVTQLGKLNALMHELQTDLSQREEHRRQVDQEFLEKKRAGQTAGEMEIYLGFLTRIRKDIAQIKDHIEKVQLACDAQRAKTIEATKDKKVMEKLKGHKKEEHRLDLARHETAMVDEAVTLRWKHS